MKNLYLSHKKNKRYKVNNLGLHCHCGETKEHLLELLQRAKNENVGVLIINNHKSLRIYSEILPKLSKQEVEPYKNMKLVPSVELSASFNYTNNEGHNYNIEVHILGYGVDIEKEKLLQEFCSRNYRFINQEEELARLIKIGHEIGLNFDEKDAYLDLNDDNRKYAGRAFMQAVMMNMDDNFCQEGETSKDKLPFELRTNWRAFQTKCVQGINSPFYLDVASLNPNVNDVIDLIHSMGGKAYLAHPAAYFPDIKTSQDIAEVIKFAEEFIAKYSPKNNQETHIDGLEVYHPSYLGNIEVISEMKELVKLHRIGSSGGTDIHVDKSLGDNESVSGDGLGGNITKNKLRRYRNLRRKAIKINALREKVIAMSGIEK